LTVIAFSSGGSLGCLLVQLELLFALLQPFRDQAVDRQSSAGDAQSYHQALAGVGKSWRLNYLLPQIPGSNKGRYEYHEEDEHVGPNGKFAQSGYPHSREV
jgi:hypothetical protein